MDKLQAIILSWLGFGGSLVLAVVALVQALVKLREARRALRAKVTIIAVPAQVSMPTPLLDIPCFSHLDACRDFAGRVCVWRCKTLEQGLANADWVAFDASADSRVFTVDDVFWEGFHAKAD